MNPNEIQNLIGCILSLSSTRALYPVFFAFLKTVVKDPEEFAEYERMYWKTYFDTLTSHIQGIENEEIQDAVQEQLNAELFEAWKRSR